MKKSLLIMLAGLLLCSCTADLEGRVDALEQDVTNLEKRVDELTQQLNSDVTNLKAIVEAMQSNVFVTGVTEIKEGDKVVGYTITLSKGSAITIYHGIDGANGYDGLNGSDGTTPKIGVTLIDGLYYWTVNGKVLTDDKGNRVPVHTDEGTPEFKYESGLWWISLDGESWSALTAASGTGDGLFVAVEYDDASVTFILSDGSKLTIPREVGFGLNIAGNEVAVAPGATVAIDYAITGASATTQVVAFADGGFSAEVKAESSSKGVIEVTAPAPLTDGKVVVFAGDNNRAAMKVLTFEEGELTVADSYTVEGEGGVVEVPVATNYAYDVVVPEACDWIEYVETRAVREETIVFNVTENTAPIERSATIKLQNGENVLGEFAITQQSQTAGYKLSDLYGDWTVSYGASGKTYTWTFVESDSTTDGNAIVYGLFGKNTKQIKVYANFNTATGVISIAMGQECEDAFGFEAYLAAKNGSTKVEYTMTEKSKFGSPTDEIGCALNEGSSAYTTLSNVSATKIDPNAAAVGHFFYSDGSHSASYDATKTAVGIIFWVGDATASDAKLQASFPECKNGLVMAINPVQGIQWQAETASIGEWQSDNLTGYESVVVAYENGATNLDKVLGYSNTQVLKAYNKANSTTPVVVYDKLVEFAEATPAPAGTSGWYIPSAKEVTYMVYGNNRNASTTSGRDNLDKLNAIIENAGFTKITYTSLASSTEISETEVYAYQGSFITKVNKTYIYTFCPVFAF